MPSGDPLVINDLLRYIAGYSEAPSRTVALEQAIQIGTGFHGKWYRSQKEHWQGYLGYKRALWAAQGKDYGIEKAQSHWSRTHCFPMIFWLAECAGVASRTLAEAEAAARIVAAKIGKDHPSRGKAARGILPWPMVEESILREQPSVVEAEAFAFSNEAFERLASLRPDCRV